MGENVVRNIHVAHIGDTRVMLASCDRTDSCLIFESDDHTPTNTDEKARLEDAGMEVRSDVDESGKGKQRIYLPGKEFPGLTMSRAFGDCICKGVSREPGYKNFTVQNDDELYAIIGSGGIWEFIDGQEAFRVTKTKVRLKGPGETLDFLVGKSRSAWSRFCRGQCDDITAILVQWNSHAKKEEEKTFQPGDNGITFQAVAAFVEPSGIVEKVEEGSQAHRAGVRPGWKVRKLEGQKFSPERFEQLKAGEAAGRRLKAGDSKEYKVIFSQECNHAFRIKRTGATGA